MDSDAGMYTLTQCVAGSPVGSIHGSPGQAIHGSPPKHYIPTQPAPHQQHPYIPNNGGVAVNWCGSETVNNGCDESSSNSSYGHPVTSEAISYCDPYTSYQQTVTNACQEIGSYSYSSPQDQHMHQPQRVESTEDIAYNNNNNTCDYNKESPHISLAVNDKYPRTRSSTRGRTKTKVNESPLKENSTKKCEASEEEHSDNSNVSNYDNVMVWLNHQACGGTVKRKRRITKTQRVAANHRERKRMVHLNTAFECLRETIPSFPYEKKLSRIQTLKLAIDYIGFMTEILYGKDTVPNHAYYSGSESPEVNRDVHYW